MNGGGLFNGRMLEFNFLPSLTLHPSRHTCFAPGDLSESMKDSDSWRATWHRHWSRNILRQLNLGLVPDIERPELIVGLLPPPNLYRLALRIGAVAYGPQLRRTIEGGRVRALKDLLGDDLFSFAWRDAPEYPLDDFPLSEEPEDPSKWELLGYGVVMAALGGADPEVEKRVELKLPLNSRDKPCLLPSDQSLDLCLRILKDMDSAWHSSFPVIR